LRCLLSQKCLNQDITITYPDPGGCPGPQEPETI
jgi:hypothetical protein